MIQFATPISFSISCTPTIPAFLQVIAAFLSWLPNNVTKTTCTIFLWVTSDSYGHTDNPHGRNLDFFYVVSFMGFILSRT